MQQPVAQGQDIALQRHQVGIGLAVEDHHVDRQAAEGPPGLGPQQRVHQRNALRRVHPHQHDRLVARQAEAPQLALVKRPAVDADARRAVHQRRGQVLQGQVFFWRQAEVAQPDLRQRRGHPNGPLHVHRLQVAVDARLEFAFVGGGRGGEGQPGDGARCQPHPHPQARDRIESVDGRAVGVHLLRRQRRCTNGSVATPEGTPVGDAFERHHFALGSGQEMRRGDLRVALQPRPPSHQEGPPLGAPAGLDEQVGKRRMRLIRRGGGQYRLECRHQLVGHGGPARVAQSDDAQFGIVLGADQHRDAGLDVLGLGVELHPVRHESSLIAPVVARCRAGRERDQIGSPFAPQVEKAAVSVAQQVVAPARHVQPVPSAGAGAAGAQRHRVAAVGQQMSGLPAVGQRAYLARLEYRQLLAVAGLGRMARIGALDDLARRALVQQHFVRHHQRIGGKPATRGIGAQHVAQRHD